MLPVVKAHQSGRCVGHTETKCWGSAVPQEPVTEAEVSKCVSCGVICLQGSFLVRLTRAIPFKNK